MTGLGLAGNLARSFLNSSLTPLLIIASLLLGLGATAILPREEEPQITVPMADIFVSLPGASAKEVEQRLTTPLEKLIRELPGVEYIYSTSQPSGALVIVRFLVGTPSEEAMVRLYSKVYANLDRIPQGAGQPLIKARSIDDVPILSFTFSSEKLGPYSLRAVAAEVERELRAVDEVSETTLIGGQQRQLRIELLPDKMAALGLDPSSLAAALQGENTRLLSGPIAEGGKSWVVGAGQFLTRPEEISKLIIGTSGSRPIFLDQVARVIDGPAQPSALAWHSKSGSEAFHDAVTLAIAKRRGANAIQVSEAVLAKLEAVRARIVPSQVEVTLTRNYGETAAERSNELLVHMLIAVVSVSLLIWAALGRREAMVVAIAIPVTLALTLAVFVLYKFTLNRVTFFALIFSIGILVDDAIVVVENVVRHLHLPGNEERPMAEVMLESVSEVGNPTILATLTVVAAILPMAFVSGLMGPYMLPIPLGASAAMIFSMLVAFTVVPWAALRILAKAPQAGEHSSKEDWLTGQYRRLMGRLLHERGVRWLFLLGVAGSLMLAMALVPLKAVVFKMLPFDNKSEFQVLVDLPEGTTLEQTSQVMRQLSVPLQEVEEVTHFQVYAGTSAPFNFNGLVRHYFLRKAPHQGDIQVNLKPKSDRKRQSHQVAKALREKLAPLAQQLGATIQVAEIPPGPPVLQTLVSEVYGPTEEGRKSLANKLRQLYLETPGVVDVDWYVEDPQPLLEMGIDSQQAQLAGLSSQSIVNTLRMASEGLPVGLFHIPTWREDIPIWLRLPAEYRGRGLGSLQMKTPSGAMVPLASLLKPSESALGSNIYHKNLLPVIYVTGDVAGKYDSPLYSILDVTQSLLSWENSPQLLFFGQPKDTHHYSLKWDGEWQVTFEVFRDLGIAFAVVLILIYALIVGWFQNFLTPLVILSAIPFSLIGIMPAHWLLGSFFTATSMIGFIAGAGIVVRNSIILVDFIELRLAEGQPLDQAVIDAGAVRFRPMMLTAAAVVVGSAVMLTDPIFNGLAISLMAGEVASLFLSRTAVPVFYYMLWKKHHVA